MSLLEALVATPLAGAVGWTLLHSLWQGAIISASLGAALMMMRSPRTRYAAACLAMLLMLGGFAVTLVVKLVSRFRISKARSSHFLYGKYLIFAWRNSSNVELTTRVCHSPVIKACQVVILSHRRKYDPGSCRISR